MDASDRRSLIIRAETPEVLREGLRSIPGYKATPFDDDLRRRMGPLREEDRFWLASRTGERIVVRHRHGDTMAETINVERQDAKEHAVPLHADELVALHDAISGMEGIHSVVVASDNDLRPSPT